jgi:hypothetical protein
MFGLVVSLKDHIPSIFFSWFEFGWERCSGVWRSWTPLKMIEFF